MTLAVRVAGVVVLELVTVSHGPFAIDVEMVTGELELEVTLMVWEAGAAPPVPAAKLRLVGVAASVDRAAARLTLTGI